MMLRTVPLVLLLFCLAPWSSAAQETESPAEDEWVEFEDPFAEEGADIDVADPVEPFNRAMFWTNDKLYFYLLKPVAKGYRIVPAPARGKVDNFFRNLGTPVRFVNCLLQGKVASAGNELRRFVFNSTLGLAGFLDPAERRGWQAADEDLGQTFGRWGLGHGFYLVIPVLGPSSVRDGIGRVGDGFLDPIPYAVTDTAEYVGVKVYDGINVLSLDDDTYEKIKEQALDPYLFVRDAYLQRRHSLVNK